MTNKFKKLVLVVIKRLNWSILAKKLSKCTKALHYVCYKNYMSAA